VNFSTNKEALMPDQPNGQNVGSNSGCVCKHPPPLERPAMNGICPDCGGHIFPVALSARQSSGKLPNQALDSDDQSALLQEH